MGRSRLLDNEHNDAFDWMNGRALKRRKSEEQRLKRKRFKSIHRNIEEYLAKRKLREDIGDELKEGDLDFFDEYEDDWYQH